MTNIITVLNKLKYSGFILHLFCQFFSFIDIDTACANTAVHWSCPGGYIEVRNAIWQTVDTNVCVNTSLDVDAFVVTTHTKNKCDNKTSCSFTVNDSSFGASCAGHCSGLSYIYGCVSKSLVLRIILIILTNFTRKQQMR